MLLDEIAYLLDTNSTARTAGTSLFKGYENEKAPDTATFIHEYGGERPQMVLSSSVPAYEIPYVQIVDRSSDYQTARNQAEVWYRLLMGQANTTLKPSSSATGTRYLALSPIQSPMYTGQDANGRHRVSTNYRVMKSLST
jgi:hypothetical protein